MAEAVSNQRRTLKIAATAAVTVAAGLVAREAAPDAVKSTAGILASPPTIVQPKEQIDVLSDEAQWKNAIDELYNEYGQGASPPNIYITENFKDQKVELLKAVYTGMAKFSEVAGFLPNSVSIRITKGLEQSSFFEEINGVNAHVMIFPKTVSPRDVNHEVGHHFLWQLVQYKFPPTWTEGLPEYIARYGMSESTLSGLPIETIQKLSFKEPRSTIFESDDPLQNRINYDLAAYAWKSIFDDLAKYGHPDILPKFVHWLYTSKKITPTMAAAYLNKETDGIFFRLQDKFVVFYLK